MFFFNFSRDLSLFIKFVLKMLLNRKYTQKQSVRGNCQKKVAKLFWVLLQNYLTSYSWSHWSCIPWVLINYQTRPKVSNCSQIVVALFKMKKKKQFYVSFKSLFNRKKGTQRTPTGKKNITLVSIFISYSFFYVGHV